jgi:L-malate glycosyltransferase
VTPIETCKRGTSSRRHPVMLMVAELGGGGSERQLTEMAKVLDRSRFEPHVAYFREGFRVPELRDAGVPVLRLPVTSLRGPSAVHGAFQLVRYLRRHRIELVHTFDWPLNIFAVPVARLFHDGAVLSSQRSHRELRTPVMRRLLRVSDRLAHSVVVNCESVRKHLIEDEAVPPERIRLCYNGVDLSVFRDTPRRRPPALPGSGLVIGVVAMMRPEKGLPTLLEAFARLACVNSSVSLLFVGNGAMEVSLRRQAGELGILSRCHFEPATRDVAPWLRAVDIFVLPSLSEAFSNSILEAMACGCAVVASRVGGNPELVRHGETGLLFEKGDAEDLAAKLRTLVDDANLRRQLADEGARMVRERFSLEASATCLAAIYEEFIARR